MGSYDDLSTLLGTYPDLIILRRFAPLAAQVLLHLQADLLELDDDLQILKDAERNDPEQQQHAKSWAKVNESIAQGRRSLRKELVEDAEKKLARYYEFIARVSSVLTLSEPDQCDIGFLRTWLESERGGQNFLKKHSAAEGTAWDSQHSRDLMAVNRRSDRFAAWVSNSVMPLYHNRLGHRLHPKTDDPSLGPRYWYDDGTFSAVGNVVCTILSSIIPSTSIVVLYYIQNMLARLLFIIALSTLFSLTMSLVAHGRRYEVFAATTAFAAVQVVFVGGVNFVAGNQSQMS